MSDAPDATPPLPAEEAASAADTLAGIEEMVMRQLRGMQEEGLQSFYSDVMGFYHAVNWSERWLLGLAALHVIIWSTMILTRRSNDAQMVLLILIRALPAFGPSSLFGHASSRGSATRRTHAHTPCPQLVLSIPPNGSTRMALHTGRASLPKTTLTRTASSSPSPSQSRCSPRPSSSSSTLW
jgi:hypothetical protein